MTSQPRTVELDAFYVIGLELRIDKQVDSITANSRIAEHWKRFIDGNVAHNIPSRVSTEVHFGVNTNYDASDRSEYSLITGVEVSSLNDIPQGMVGVKVPASRYLVFTAHGEIPDAIQEGWKQVNAFFSDNASYQRSFGADFEIYDTTKHGRAEIYVSIL